MRHLQSDSKLDGNGVVVADAASDVPLGNRFLIYTLFLEQRLGAAR